MSIKGFPSSQKLPLGTGITNEFVTVQPSDEYRFSLDAGRFAFRVDSDTVPRTAAALTGNVDGVTWIYDTLTPAKKGDFIRFETGNNAFLEVAIVKVETNRFLLGALLDPAPVAGDTFYILRAATQRVDDTGSQVVSISSLNVGPTGATAPIYANEIGFINGSGNLQGVSPSQPLPVTSASLPLPSGAATAANQTNGNQLTQITDGSGASVTVHNISTTMNGGDKALVTMAAIHGKNGGSYLDLLCDATGILSANIQNFPATQPVSGTVAATQSGTWGVGLNAGTNIAGKFGIDQTTNGTTNAVYVNNFPATQAVTGTFWQATQPVSGTFWQATQPVSAASLPLPSNASTANPEGSLTGGTAGSKSLAAGGIYNSSAPTLTNGQQAALQLDASGNLKTTATFTGSIGAVNQGTAAAVASAWPILMTDGTNTASVKAASTAAVAGDKAVVVTVSPNTPLPAGTNTIGYIKKAGLTKSNTPVYNSYSSTSVTTSAYVQLIASTTSLANMVQIFDSSGQAGILAIGGAGSEVDQLYIPPGGGDFNLYIAAGSRVSYKMLTGNATSGYLLINLLG